MLFFPKMLPQSYNDHIDVICSILTCSSPGDGIWLWWSDFFITHDFYLIICPDISKIRHKEVSDHLHLVLLRDNCLYCFSIACIGGGRKVVFIRHIEFFQMYGFIKTNYNVFPKPFIDKYIHTGVGLSCRCIKQFAWLLAIIQSLLIIASRKHYTVDIVVAW